ncbi:MAG: 50S ribosomal protein L25 [Patescibacteria group bacterium]
MANKRPVLKVEKREIFGRKVKKLRKDGLLPATVYGKKVKSISVKGDLKEFVALLDQVGETGLVDLKVKGDKEEKAVLLKNPQYHPVGDQLIHIDLHQVDLSEKVTVAVPVEITGEALVVKRGEGVLIHQLTEIEVEALPTDLPEKFVVDVSKLEKVDQTITVADLGIDTKKISPQVEETQVVVKIDPLAEEEEEPVAAPAEGEEAVTEGEEGKAAPSAEAKEPVEGGEQKKEAKEEKK